MQSVQGVGEVNYCLKREIPSVREIIAFIEVMRGRPREPVAGGKGPFIRVIGQRICTTWISWVDSLPLFGLHVISVLGVGQSSLVVLILIWPLSFGRLISTWGLLILKVISISNLSLAIALLMAGKVLLPGVILLLHNFNLAVAVSLLI
jgi:hypothetical protein